MEKIFNRTKEEWMESIKKSIALKQKAIADAQAQLKAERLVIKRGKVVINQLTNVSSVCSELPGRQYYE